MIRGHQGSGYRKSRGLLPRCLAPPALLTATVALFSRLEGGGKWRGLYMLRAHILCAWSRMDTCPCPCTCACKCICNMYMSQMYMYTCTGHMSYTPHKWDEAPCTLLLSSVTHQRLLHLMALFTHLPGEEWRPPSLRN